MNSEVSNKQFFDTINLYKIDKKPFVVYRMPNSKALVFKSGYTTRGMLKETTKSQFFFMPFKKSNGYIISEGLCLKTPYSNKNFNPQKSTLNSKDIVSKSEKTKYLSSVKLLIDKIKSSELMKIVFSKKISINYSSLNYLKVYQNILNLYENAFCYLFYHPIEGFWVGASPELLFKKENSELSTMALAGTKFNLKDSWTDKEKEEQEIVKNEIYNKLLPLCSELSVGETTTSQAGSVQHLKTLFKGKSTASVFKILETLFPTSAIAGLPKDPALSLIFEHEEHSRSFYSGFLGSTENNFAFSFVNLRCLNLKSNKAYIYVGSGITKDSIPIKEWDEILKKSETMLSALI